MLFSPRHFASRCFVLAALFLAALLGGFVASPASATTLPVGFTESWVAGGLLKPTSMTFAPDGRIFICEQEGQLRVIKNGVLLPTPFVSLDVNFTEERGLVGVVLDPAFASNKYVYVYYTAKTPTLHNRVSRFTANGDVALAGSEQVILDLDDLGASGIHNGGAMRFGNDGKLYVAVGENNIPAYAQSFSNMLGKLLRINKDGTIPTDNPFYNSTTGKNRSIYALGFRNPFNFDIQSTTGRIFINEVGGSAWEEINDILPGRNYGWPTTEGATTDPRFTTPTFAYPHGEGPEDGCAVTGGAFYNPSTAMFPAQYQGKYFFTDYCGGWIRLLDPATKTASTFASALPPYPVNLTVGPDGALYYISHGHGAVYKITSSNEVAPAITRQPASLTRSVGQSATFEVGASGSGTLTYQWQRNTVNISGATSATYAISAVVAGDNNAQFRCIVSNSFGSATSNSATLTVSTNRAPVAAITAPAINTLFSGGQVINYSGTGTDAEDGTLPASAFIWRVDFHHADHVHPFLPATSGATSGSFTAGNRGEAAANVWYRIHLTVRDAQGVTHSVFQDVQPRTVQITLQAVPAGLKVNLDSQPQSTPSTVTAVVGVIRSLEAFTQTVDGKTYTFKSWADGGLATREITTPTTNTTYTATYEENSAPVNSALTITNPVNGEQLDAFNAINGSVNITSLQRVDLVITRSSDGKQWNGTAWVAPDTGIATILNGTTWSANGTQLPKGTNLPVGNYVLKAVAFDIANNVTVSALTTVTIMTQATGGPNTVVAITSPANGATLSTLDAVSGTVSAASGTTLTRVDLVITRSDGKQWDGATWVAPDTGIATVINGNTWSTPAATLPKGANLPGGVYELKSVAFDSSGNVGVGINSVTIASNIALTNLTLSPTNVAGGAASTGTLTVSAPAPDDTVISLSSSNASVASVPSTVTVPMGATTFNFTISTPTRTAASSAVITATMSGISKTATLNVTVTPIAPPPPPVVRPDALIKLGSEPDSAYAVDNTYQSTPAANQSKRQVVAYGVKATHLVRIQNDGTAAQSFVVKAVETAEPGWSVVYKVGTTVVTTALKGTTGKATASLAPGASETIVVEMTPISPNAKGTIKGATFNVFNNSSDAVVRDSVQATASTPAIPFDLQLQSGATIVGKGVINTNAVDQSLTASVRKTQTATYFIRFANNAAANEQIKLKSTAGSAGWTVRYFDANNMDITSSVIAGSWTSPQIATRTLYSVKCTVSPNSGVAVGTNFSILATATAVTNGARQDAVKATSTAIQ